VTTHVAADALNGRERYQALIDSILPRPVAWVLTLAEDGVPNLAPFSFFSGVCARPPVVSIAISSKPVGAGREREFVEKDTTRNARRSGGLVVHIASADLAAAVQETAADHPAGTDVPALLGLETAPGVWGDVPWLPGLPVAMECRLHDVIEVGSPATHLVLAEVLGWHFRDGVVGPDGRPNVAGVDPVARLGVDRYGRVTPRGGS